MASSAFQALPHDVLQRVLAAYCNEKATERLSLPRGHSRPVRHAKYTLPTCVQQRNIVQSSAHEKVKWRTQTRV